LRQRGAASDYDDGESIVTSRCVYEPRYDDKAYAAGDPLWRIYTFVIFLCCRDRI